MKNILLFGAGKSATVLIDYLLSNAKKEDWMLWIVDADLALAQHKTGGSPYGKAISFDINDEASRKPYIQQAHLVISLLPPSLHFLIAQDCITYKKNFLTASYVDEKMQSLKAAIKEANLLFLCEMGLDPGIDHMSAKKMIDSIEQEGGVITSFISHCGGLVAPESDDNPWHYKISWNPRNVVTAGKAGAIYKQNGEIQTATYEQLFSEKRQVEIPGHEVLSWYPNRDSLPYIKTYGLQNCSTFIRTTLRHPDFMYGWKHLIDLKLTDEVPVYDMRQKSLMQFFKEHLLKHGFTSWMHQKLGEQLNGTRNLLEDLAKQVQQQKESVDWPFEETNHYAVVNEKGSLQKRDLKELISETADNVVDKIHEANLTLKQLLYLGANDSETLINKDRCSAADVLQLMLEKKLALQPEDKDMVVMLHELEYKKANRRYKTCSCLVVKGRDGEHTAMAKTVGLPLGIAAKLILNGTMQLTGLQIPVVKEIYEPVLEELKKLEVSFTEETHQVL